MIDRVNKSGGLDEELKSITSKQKKLGAFLATGYLHVGASQARHNDAVTPKTWTADRSADHD